MRHTLIIEGKYKWVLDDERNCHGNVIVNIK